MTKHKLVEPRLDTPSPDASNATGLFGLPDALVSEHVQRLAVCAAIGAGLWTYGLVTDTVIRPLTLSIRIPQSNVILDIVAIVVSLAMFAYVRYSSHSHERKADAGLVYFVLNAAAVGLLNTWIGLASITNGLGVSWNTVVILIAAMVLPATPGKMFVAAFSRLDATLFFEERTPVRVNEFQEVVRALPVFVHIGRHELA